MVGAVSQVQQDLKKTHKIPKEKKIKMSVSQMTYQASFVLSRKTALTIKNSS